MTAAAPQGRRLFRALRLDVVALVHVILVVAGVCYAALVVDPRVTDPAGAGNGLFLFDSSAYLETARHVNILSLFHLGRARARVSLLSERTLSC